MTFNIASAIEIDETFDVELVHPKSGDVISGEGGLPCSITVYGPASRQFAAAKAKNNLRAIEHLKRRGKQEANPEEEAADRARFLASITKSFNNFTYNDMEAGEAAFRAFYLDPKMGWALDLVNGAAGDWANFTPAFSTSS